MTTVEPLDKGYIGTSDLILNCPLLKGFHFQMLNTLLALTNRGTIIGLQDPIPQQLPTPTHHYF